MENQEEIINILAKDYQLSRIREAEKRDKYLFTTTAGTLVLSVTFLVNIIIKTKLFSLNTLFWAWALLVLSLVIQLLSFVFVDLHFAKKLKYLPTGIIEDKTCWGDLVEFFNKLSIVLTVIGILLLTYFGYLNITHINLI